MNPKKKFVLLVLLYLVVPLSDAIMANPRSFRDRQPSGELTPLLHIKGGPRFHYLLDEDGFTVVQDKQKRFVYAKQNGVTGRMVPTSTALGEGNASDIGLVPNLTPSETMTEELCGRMCKTNQLGVSSELLRTGSMGSVASSTQEKRANLVILMRFADHADRKLPPPSDFEILFNNRGPEVSAAPTGSVRDYFLVNSYEKLDVQSTIYGWITLPNTESYYASGRSGLGSRFLEGLLDALRILEADPSFTFKNFDADGDGFVDIVTLMHSGFGAEWGIADAYGQASRDRIWSHKWTLPPSMYWKGKDNVSVALYVTCTALWDIRGEKIGRIGVIVHETGHALGLPDLYGGLEDAGIGSYGMMGNSWGFDGTQLYPSMMSAWAKLQLGWVRPISVTRSGTFSIAAAVNTDIVYRIDLNVAKSEYLLIENRQKVLFDSHLPHGGLAIWHIDDRASHTKAGFPGQSSWPQNGRHYRVALLQADGAFDLENGVNFGDYGDLFRQNWRDSIGPSVSGFGPYPNTDAYQFGKIFLSNVTVSQISSIGTVMSFTVALDPLCPGLS